MLFKCDNGLAALTLHGEEFKVVDGILDSGELPLTQENLGLLASFGLTPAPEQEEVVEDVKPARKTRAKPAAE